MLSLVNYNLTANLTSELTKFEGGIWSGNSVRFPDWLGSFCDNYKMNGSYIHMFNSTYPQGVQYDDNPAKKEEYMKYIFCFNFFWDYC